MSEKYVGCAVRELPHDKRVGAAKQAIALNPANAPARPPSLAAMAPLSPEHLAALTGKLWSAKGVNLTVQFLDDPDAETRRKILSHMSAWNRTGNVAFRETASGGQVRIARQRGQGYWSYLGTDVLSIPQGEPTMNLEGFTASGTPDSEFYRVVRHETGHTLGFPHEHLRREIIQRLDPAKTVAYFLANDGWDAETTRQQVLTPLSDSGLTALPADVLSIMCYKLPPEITKDGKDIPGGDDINDEDYTLCGKLYPKSGTGGGGGGGGPTPAGKLFTLTFRQPVRAGGQVSFRARVAIPPGAYDVIPEGVTGHAEVEAT
jgi:hypothetical protein